MLKVVSTVLALVVSLVLVDNLMAQQQPGRGRGGRGGMQMQQMRPMYDRVLRMQNLNLTDDQKAKLEEMKKEYDPKVKDATAKVEGVITAEQKKAREDALKEARDAGKRGQEVRDAAQAAMKLTDAQKADMKKFRQVVTDLNKEITDKVNALLTDAQKETLKARGGRGGGRRGGNGGGNNAPTT
jgi:hypothetical protein